MELPSRLVRLMCSNLKISRAFDSSSNSSISTLQQINQHSYAFWFFPLCVSNYLCFRHLCVYLIFHAIFFFVFTRFNCLYNNNTQQLLKFFLSVRITLLSKMRTHPHTKHKTHIKYVFLYFEHVM